MNAVLGSVYTIVITIFYSAQCVIKCLEIFNMEISFQRNLWESVLMDFGRKR